MSINANAKHGARYRRVSIEMYADEKFLTLSAPKPSGQGLWIYLLTGPFSTLIPGIIIGGAAGMAEALGWPLVAFRRCFQEITDNGMARTDWTARLVFLPNALRHNQPQSPSVVTGWRQAWAEVPASGLKQEAAAHIHWMLAAHGAAYATAFAAFALPTGQPDTQGGTQPAPQPVDRPAPQAAPHQEQEQEQEQDALQNPVERPRARGAGNRGGVGAGTFPGDHLNHLACGPVCFKPHIARDYIGRFAADRAAMIAWAQRVCERWQPRVDRGERPQANDFKFWAAEYDADFPPAHASASARTVPDAASTDDYLTSLRGARG